MCVHGFTSFLILMPLYVYSYLITLASTSRTKLNHIENSEHLCLLGNFSSVSLSSKILTTGLAVYIFYYVDQEAIYIQFLGLS